MKETFSTHLAKAKDEMPSFCSLGSSIPFSTTARGSSHYRQALLNRFVSLTCCRHPASIPNRPTLGECKEKCCGGILLQSCVGDTGLNQLVPRCWRVFEVQTDVDGPDPGSLSEL